MDCPQNSLEPLPYHLELRDYLKTHEGELWKWFSSAKAKEDYTEHLRLELLKTTYRLDPQGHPELYAAVEEAKRQMRVEIPVTLYQAQNNPHLNATLFYMPGEGHIVFSGPVLSLLNPEELKSVIGHELAHYHLLNRDGSDFHIADRLVHAVGNDPRASSSHEQTARRFQLYTEIFADRGSLCVTDNVEVVVSSLVKLETGLQQVSAAGYLKQADEIFAKGDISTAGVSHPETFIRARSLALWKEEQAAANARIAAMIEGAAAMDELDLLGQLRVTKVTRELMQEFLRPAWFQTPAVLGHARMFFSDFRPPVQPPPLAWEPLAFKDPRLREYFCYVLLDFTKVDPELDDLPLAAALEFSRKLDLDAPFEKIAARELKLKLRDLRKLKENAAERLASAEAER